jgi:hypothetical protein
MHQVVSNLLGNALKFTYMSSPSGSVQGRTGQEIASPLTVPRA